MPFKGTPNSGGVNPIALALQIRQMRSRAEAQKAKDRNDRLKTINDIQIARGKEQREMQKFELDRAKGLSELQEQFSGQEQAIGPLISAANNRELPLNERQSSADQSIRDINRSILNRAQAGQDVSSAAGIVGGNAGSQIAVDRAETLADLSEAKATESRAEEVAKRKERRDINAISDREAEKFGSKLRQPELIVGRISRLKREIAKIEQAGGDASEIKESVSILEDMKENLRKGSQISIQTALPPSERLKLIRSVHARDRDISLVSNLSDLIDSGEIVMGLPGSVENLRQRFRGMGEDILNNDEVPEEIKEKFRDAFDTGSAKIEVDGGKQLTLGLDQMSLAWAFVRGGRDSARFTLLEYSNAMSELGFTGVWKSTRQVKGALSKVLRRTLEQRSQEAWILKEAGIELRGNTAELSPEDRDLLNRVGSVKSNNITGTGELVPSGATTSPSFKPTSKELMKMSDDEKWEWFKGLQNE